MNQHIEFAFSSAVLRAAFLGVAKGTLVLTVVLVMAELLRRRCATDRYRVRVAGFAALVIVPLASMLIPDRTVAWLPVWSGDPAVIASGATSPLLVSPGTVPLAVGVADAAAAAASPPAGIEWIVAAIWVLGAIVALMPTLLSLAHRQALRRMAPPLDTPEWRHAVEQAAKAVRFRGEVQLIAGGSGVAPMTWGSAPAVVIVPAEAAAWSSSCREAVMHHELAHAQRRDANTLLWCRLIAACYWFNPLVWLAYARLRVEQELAADELVVQSGRSTVGYAESLLQVLQGIRQARLLPGVAAAGRRSELEHRIRSILRDEYPRPLRGATKYAMLGVVALLATAVAPLEPVAQQPLPSGAGGFRLNWQLNGHDEEIVLSGDVQQANQLSTLRFAGEGQLMIESRTAQGRGASPEHRPVLTGTSTGVTRQEWWRDGSATAMTAADRAWVDERLRYLVASIQLRDQERLLRSVRDSVMAAGGLVPAQLSETDRTRRWEAIERISTQRLAVMQRREQQAADGAAPWQLLGLDREALRLSWAELEAAGVSRP